MDLFILVLLLLLIIGLSNFINHFVPYIPVPIIQIALGIGAAFIQPGEHIMLEPELFFVLFIAPLLFHDGKNVPRTALWKYRKPILLLALGLVFLTVFVLGHFIHWLIPSIPLPAAYALAAILSPTDVVAVGAIAKRLNIPGNLMHILEGEGLMNDASGLVAFKFAVAAAVTGVFSFTEASISFVVISLGGLIAGAILAYFLIRVRMYIRKLGMEDVTIHMLIQILSPFLIFLVAEHFHLSGILAVVAGGIVHAIERDREETPSIELQIVSNSTWSVILYILNGMVFVLLGLQLPDVAKETFENPFVSNLEALRHVLLITVALLLIRFIWVSLSWFLGAKKDQEPYPTFVSISILTISGVRGAVTLAGAFTIPYVIGDGTLFPERSLILFIAGGVILATLTIASIVLPIIARPEETGASADEEKAVRVRVYQAAEARVRELMTEQNREAAIAVLASYNRMIADLQFGRENLRSPAYQKEEKRLRFLALKAESHCIAGLVKEGFVSRDLAYLLEEHVRRMETAVSSGLKYRLLVTWALMKRWFLLFIRSFSEKREGRMGRARLNRKRQWICKIKMAEAAISVLKEETDDWNGTISLNIISEYNKMITAFKNAQNEEAAVRYNQEKRGMEIQAFQAERNEIQRLYEVEAVPLETVRKIRRQIAIRQVYWNEAHSLKESTSAHE